MKSRTSLVASLLHFLLLKYNIQREIRCSGQDACRGPRSVAPCPGDSPPFCTMLITTSLNILFSPADNGIFMSVFCLISRVVTLCSCVHPFTQLISHYIVYHSFILYCELHPILFPSTSLTFEFRSRPSGPLYRVCPSLEAILTW